MKPNYELPDGDHLVVPPVERRSKRALADACDAALLARDWSLMSPGDREEALDVARVFGREFAKAFEEDGRGDSEANYSTYVNTCVWWAFKTQKVINDIEFGLWEHPVYDAPEDPRVGAFAEGCYAYRIKRLKKAS